MIKPVNKFPEINKELIDVLEALFPDKAPSETQLSDFYGIAFRAGQVDVVRFLRSKFKEQNTLERQSVFS